MEKLSLRNSFVITTTSTKNIASQLFEGANGKQQRYSPLRTGTSPLAHSAVCYAIPVTLILNGFSSPNYVSLCKLLFVL